MPTLTSLPRRAILVAGGLCYFGFDPAGRTVAAVPDSPRRSVARSAIMIWLSGGASHIDAWDTKPYAPEEYRGTLRPVATPAPGVRLCEHLPHLAKQSHHPDVVRSLGGHRRDTGDHHAGYYYNLTGRAPDRTLHQLRNARTPHPTHRPPMASVIASEQPPPSNLPSAISPATPSNRPAVHATGHAGRDSRVTHV